MLDPLTSMMFSPLSDNIYIFINYIKTSFKFVKTSLLRDSSFFEKFNYKLVVFRVGENTFQFLQSNLAFQLKVIIVLFFLRCLVFLFILFFFSFLLHLLLCFLCFFFVFIFFKVMPDSNRTFLAFEVQII